LYFGTPSTYDPPSNAIGASGATYDFGYLNVWDKIGFSFTVSGGPVYYWIADHYFNVIIDGYGGQPASSGGAGFLVAEQGNYYIVFEYAGSPSTVTLHYTHWPHQ
jgi:hypothetical protein